MQRRHHLHRTYSTKCSGRIVKEASNGRLFAVQVDSRGYALPRLDLICKSLRILHSRNPTSDPFLDLSEYFKTLNLTLTTSEASEILKSLSSPTLALQFFHFCPLTIPKFKHDVSTFNRILLILSKSSCDDRFGNVKQIVDEMERCGVRGSISTVNILIGMFGGCAELERCLELVRKWELRMNCYTYKCLLQAYLRCKDLSRALEVYGEMRGCGYVLDIFAYNMLLDSLAKDGKVDQARKVFEDMKRKHCEPDEYTYTIMVRMTGRLGRPDESLAFFQAMLSKGCILTGRYIMELVTLQVQMYLIFGTILFLLADIGSCKDTSISKASYISEPYFKKYDSLIDSYFQEFLAHEVPLGFCEVLQDKINPAPRLSILHRHLIGEGSHRRLSTSIRHEINQESNSALPDHSCEAIIIEKLPSGVFADPFELQDLLHRGVYMEASVFGDTDLESPSIQSNQSLVEIHMDVGSNALSGSKNELEIYIELPIHARYPPLGEHGYSRIEFGLPDLFTRCNVKGKSHSEICIFKSTVSTAKALGDGIVWEVPSGNKKHATTVSYLTFISAILSALSIVFVSVRHSNFGTDDKKQS